MDAWDAAKVASLDVRMKEKYDRRYQRGDIIEVYPDGEAESKISGNPDFLVVKVPRMAFDPDMKEPLLKSDHIDKKGRKISLTTKRRKWNIDETKIPEIVKNKIDIGDRVIAVTSGQLSTCLKKKS